MKLVQTAMTILCMSSVCLGQSAREIAAHAFKSVVLLEMTDSDGQPLSLGSGFFISGGIIATNAHVIDGAAGGTARLVGHAHSLQILGTVAIDRHADLALLKVNSSAPALALGPNATPTVGDEVYVVGNPLGLEGTFSEGIIGGVREIGHDSILQMTAPISPGSSGGAVMDHSGTVIGISVATFQGGQNLNLAVPVSYLSKLFASHSQHVIPLNNTKTSTQADVSMLSGVGTETEKGLAISDYQLGLEEGLFQQGKFEFRLTNKLPVVIFDVHLLFLYYDPHGALMNYEKLDVSYYSPGGHDVIPAGLAKTIYASPADVSQHEAEYYKSKGIAPNVQIRILGFKKDQSQ